MPQEPAPTSAHRPAVDSIERSRRFTEHEKRRLENDFDRAQELDASYRRGFAVGRRRAAEDVAKLINAATGETRNVYLLAAHVALQGPQDVSSVEPAPPATYDDAIRALLAVPSNETHVAADWLEARRDGREPEFATTPRSWSLPVIPDDVTRVRDAEGRIWTRATSEARPDRWWQSDLTRHEPESYVLGARGPLTEVTEEQP